MPVQATIIVSFAAESTADVEQVVAELGAPEGAQVSATVTEQVVVGTVEAGALVASATPEDDEPPPE